jgi:hypothetical protein
MQSHAAQALVSQAGIKVGTAAATVVVVVFIGTQI